MNEFYTKFGIPKPKEYHGLIGGPKKIKAEKEEIDLGALSINKEVLEK